MAKRLDHISPTLQDFIGRQPLFFVGTAAPDGWVNVSPKGMGLRVLSPNVVAWLSVTGSGNETAAHLLEHPRMTLMFCAFTGPPLILRLYGEARTVQPGDPDWEEAALFPTLRDARQVYFLTMDLVQTSCEMAVPHLEFAAPRTDLNDWAAAKAPGQLAEYRPPEEHPEPGPAAHRPARRPHPRRRY